MKNTLTNMLPRQKATIRNYIIESVRNGETLPQAYARVRQYVEENHLINYNEGTHDVLKALTIHFYANEVAKKKGIPAHKLVYSYIMWKMKIAKELNDKGAFGDAIEICVRYASKPHSLFTYNDLHVQTGNRTDVKLRGKKFEIAHNGKTFNEGTYDNPMYGSYELIAYGMIDKTERNIVIRKIKETKNPDKLVNLILSCLYVFPKDEFFAFMMDNSKMGKNAIEWKTHLQRWQVRFNDGKLNCFTKAIENADYPTLADWIASH